MKVGVGLLALSGLVVSLSAATFAQQIPIGEAAEHAVAQSKLTTPGSPPFHLKAKILEKDSPETDRIADIEVFWVAPDKWRRTIQSPDFTQTLIINGDKIFEQDEDDYYALWLRELVTALLDPLPVLEVLKQSNTLISKPPNSPLANSCLRFQTKVGVAPVENIAFSAICFEGSYGLLNYVGIPGYSVEFKDYKRFKEKLVPYLLVTNPEPGTTIEAKITELSELKDPDESLFAIAHPSPKQELVRSVFLPEAPLRGLALQTPDIVWPTVRGGKTSGVLSIYVSVDRSGHVRETFPGNSANPGLDDTVRQQVQKWQFKPAVSDGQPVQVEGYLTFAFNTKIENPVMLLSDAEARKLATHLIEPQIPPGAAPPGTTFVVRVSIGPDGKLLGAGNPNNVPSVLFLAGYEALQQWHFQPFLKDGKPDFYKADISFQVR
ncbi:MAG: energy transducer TonB [Acidobacteriia bacterium]|nr:energy transducer TonB [Terriglobia bacterium]